MHIRIAYYSGSGNTQYVGNLLRKYLSQRHEVSTFFIKKGRVMDDNFDALVLGFPVYAYMPPKTVLKFVRTLNGNKRPVFLYLTKGLISGDAARTLALELKNSGFIVVGVKDVLMADSLFILLAKEGTFIHKIMLLPNKNIDERIEKLTHLVENRFLSGKEVIPRKKLYVPLTLMIAKMFWRKEQKWQKAFFADSKCNLCGACVGLCPTVNIKIEDGRVIWGENCDFCLRCLHRCPQQAIQIENYTKKSPRYRGPAP